MIDSRVLACMNLHLAQAAYKLTELEALEKQTPNTTSTSNTRLTLARRLRSARDLRNGWERALIAVGAYLQDDEDSIGLETELKAAPERIVAQSAYVEDQDNLVYCNRAVCYGMRPDGRTRLVPLTSADLPDGAICVQCGTDVLA